MLSNSKVKTYFHPCVFLNIGYQLEVVEEIKIFGMKISGDLKWNENTKCIVMKADRLRATQVQIIPGYNKKVLRPVLESAQACARKCSGVC